ncbi:MAG: hypothetical protein NWE89_02780 [Candidatus Bathyarchaeota archaeon]|nr:hypothetical protein [Candidatus Bathyarchaeota archaeon]
MKVFNKTINRGEKATFTAGVASYPNGDPVSITARVAVGKNEGPRVAVLGVQHDSDSFTSFHECLSVNADTLRVIATE